MEVQEECWDLSRGNPLKPFPLQFLEFSLGGRKTHRAQVCGCEGLYIHLYICLYMCHRVKIGLI